MRTIFLTAALLPFLCTGALAEEPFQAPALLIKENGDSREAWILTATKTDMRLRERNKTREIIDAPISGYQSILVHEPREFTVAMDLYQARRYREAKEMFIGVKERFMPVYPLENSPAALAAFYELECLRKLGDLDGLAAAFQNFDKGPLTRETQLRQLELYVMWDAVRSRSWESLEKLAAERIQTRLPADQRAQVAYCHGLALEGLGKTDEAIDAYQMAMTADAGASEDVTREAALRVMAILTADADVRKAMKAWGTPEEDRSSPGREKLIEAAAVAGLYEMTLGAGNPLPTEFLGLLKFRPEMNPSEPKQGRKPK